MDDVSKAGLQNAMPTSFEICEIFTPPKPVNCGVFGKFKKLNVELPPSVCALETDVVNKKIMIIRNCTGYEYEKSFGKPVEICCSADLFGRVEDINVPGYSILSGLKLKLLHKNGGVSFNP